MYSFEFHVLKIMSFVVGDRFTSFLTWKPFISCCFLIALTRTSSTILNRHGKSDHFYFVFDLWGGKFSVFHDYVWCELWIFHRVPFTRLRKFTSFSSLFIFIGEGFWLYQMTVTYLLKWSCGFLPFILLIWYIISINFLMLNKPCIVGLNLSQSWFTIFCICCWIYLWLFFVCLLVFCDEILHLNS